MKLKTPHLLIALLAIYLLAFLVACGDDEEPTPQTMIVPLASNVSIEDTKNNGNASDISISFTKASDETNISEYRVILVKTSKSRTFNLENALMTAMGSYQSVATTGIDQSLLLDAALTDSDGDAIANGGDYAAFVVSVAVTSDELVSSISSPSNEITLGDFSIKISYMGNMGVVISDGNKQVIIDGVHGNLSGWYQASATSLNNLIRGNAPWGNSDILMTTHAHGDHFSRTSTNTFLSRNPNALYIAPKPARNGVTSSSQVSSIDPSRGSSTTIEHNGISVEILHIRHFDQFGNDFSGSANDNYAFIVTIGGKKVMHVGDAFYSTANFAPFNITGKGIDVLIIPTFNTLVSTSNRDIVNSTIRPKNIIAAHLQTSTSVSAVRTVYPTATIFTNSADFKQY